MKNYTRLVKSARCNKMRAVEALSLKSGKGSGNAYEKSALIKEAIRKGLYKVATEDELEAELALSFQNLDYPSPETAKKQAADAFRQVHRYISSEKRTPHGGYPVTVEPFGLLSYDVRPDYKYTGTRSFEFEVMQGKKKVKQTVTRPYIEMVKIFCRKPDVTLTGRQKDSGVMQNLEMYCLLLAARKEADRMFQSGEFPANKPVVVCASYYYLRKNTDRNGTNPNFDVNFFAGQGAGNIVTLFEEYLPGTQTKLDLEFKPQFEEFVKGEDCEGDACKGCLLEEICNFKRPPKAEV